MNVRKKSSQMPMMIIIAMVSLGIGFFLGRVSPETQAVSADAEEIEQKETAKEVKQAPKISPEQLAEQKNVPAAIQSPQGQYILVAVVEGVEANHSLNRSLNVVNIQRQRLAQLSSRYEQTDISLAQQRELIAREINQTRKTLENNLSFMAQNYAYTLDHQYLLVPHVATLSRVEGSAEDQKTSLIYRFDNAESYEEFQKKSSAYAQLKREQIKSARDQKPTHPLQPIPTNGDGENQPLPLTPAMEKARTEMIKQYGCDPEKEYLIEFHKTALYARQAK